MYSATYTFNRDSNCLEVLAYGSEGVNRIKQPMRPFFRCLTDDVDAVLGVARSVCDGVHAVKERYRFVEDGRPTFTLSTRLPNEVTAIREKCRVKGLGYKRVLEADVPFIRNWMLEHDVRCATSYRKLYYDIEVWDKDGKPSVRDAKHPIICIGAADSDGRSFFFTAPHATVEEALANEKSILQGFSDLISTQHYGLNVGWYSGGGGTSEKSEASFDYPYLRARTLKCNVKFPFNAVRWVDLVLPFIYTREHKWKSTSLDYVAKQLLGKGKKLKPDSGRVADMAYEELRSYNLGSEEDPGDVWLTKLIDAAAMDGSGGCLTDLMVKIANETHIFPDEVLYTPNIYTVTPKPSRAIDALLLEEGRRLGYAYPSKPSASERPIHKKYSGAIIVRQPMPGVYRNIMVYDVESLYPFCILLEKVSPDLNGEILPSIMRRYLARKRNASNKIERNVYKIILNASYGSLGSPFTRVYDRVKAEKITTTARNTISKAADMFESLGHKIIYGDTDSAFLQLTDDPRHLGINMKMFAESVVCDVVNGIRASVDIDADFNMPPAYFASEILFTRLGGGKVGARKRYYLHATWDEKKGDCDYYKKVGIDAVRSDNFALLARTQEAILRLKLDGRDVEAEDYVKHIRDDLYGGRVDPVDLVISKGLGKEKYKVKLPHVRVYDDLVRRGLWNAQDSKVHYVHSKHGPVAWLGVPVRDVDYNHYFSLVKGMAARADVNVDGGDGGSMSLDLFSS